MENIIIWVVFIAIGALWEFISKKKDDTGAKKRSGSPDTTPRTRIATASAARTAPPSATPPLPAAMPKRIEPHTTAAYQPAVVVMNDTDLPEVEILSESTGCDTPEQTAEREAHFRRWRQAIIDTQILQRKF